mgnify:CR=1 FL=1
MFFSIDESCDNQTKILGGVLSPNDNIPEYEKKFAQLRIENKLFGEIKWGEIDQYAERYVKFLDIFLDDTTSTYHSICYRDNSGKYHAAYSLIRTVTWKIENYCRKINDFTYMKEPFYVLFDNNESEGQIGTSEIKEINPRDPNFKIPLDFCNQGTSHIIGHLQLTDLLTGAVSYRVNNLSPNKNQARIIDHIISKNQGIDLNFSANKLPGLYEYKIQMFDPDNK